MFGMKFLLRKPGLKTSTKEERKVFQKIFHGEEITDAEVIDAIRSVPCHYVTGPSDQGDGTTVASARTGRKGEAIIAEGQGRYREPVSRGLVFTCSEQGSGVAVGATLTTTSLFNLYNPTGSTFSLSILRTSCVYASGTLGTGVLYHCANYATTTTVPSGGTALTVRSCLIGSGAAPASGCRAAVGDTVTAPVAVFPMFYLAPELATSVTAPQYGEQDLQGLLEILPGCQYQIQAVAAAGSSPKMSPGCMFQEVKAVA